MSTVNQALSLLTQRLRDKLYANMAKQGTLLAFSLPRTEEDIGHPIRFTIPNQVTYPVEEPRKSFTINTPLEKSATVGYDEWCNELHNPMASSYDRRPQLKVGPLGTVIHNPDYVETFDSEIGGLHIPNEEIPWFLTNRTDTDMQHKGIGHLTALVSFVIVAITAGKKAMADGSVGVGDIATLFPVLGQANDAFKNVGEVPAELADLSAAEADELVSQVQGEVGDWIPDGKAEDVVNAALRAIPFIVAIYDAAVGIPQVDTPAEPA